jgi:hypothetical protein
MWLLGRVTLMQVELKQLTVLHATYNTCSHALAQGSIARAKGVL